VAKPLKTKNRSKSVAASTGVDSVAQVYASNLGQSSFLLLFSKKQAKPLRWYQKIVSQFSDGTRVDGIVQLLYKAGSLEAASAYTFFK
jgi:hypothetical protein